MNGTKESWTPERRAAQAERMRQRFKDPAHRAAHAAKMAKAMQDPARRAASSARMKKLNARIRDDDTLRAKVIRGQKRVRRAPQYRAIQSAVMKDLMARRRELRRGARFHCISINKNPKVRKRQWASRRRKAARAAVALELPRAP